MAAGSRCSDRWIDHASGCEPHRISEQEVALYMRVTPGRCADPAIPNSDAARQILDELFTLVRGMPGNASDTEAVDPTRTAT